MKKTAPPVPPQLLKSAAAAAFIGVGRTTFYKLMADNPILQPITVTGLKHPRWRKIDLEKYVESLVNRD